MNKEHAVIDKSLWGPGPWQDEPDRVEWGHGGLPCLALRNHHGNWCGYAAVAPGHPLHGVSYSDESPALAAALDALKHRPFTEQDYTFKRGIAMLFGDARPTPDLVIDVHGGLTYADACHGPICHVPQPGEPDDVWWFGFDCGHCDDIAPGMDALLRKVYADKGDVWEPHHLHGAEYRTLAYVQAETNKLAEQLAVLANPGEQASE